MEHSISFSNTGSVPEENFQVTAFSIMLRIFLFDALQQFIRIWTLLLVVNGRLLLFIYRFIIIQC
jgi:hypothetical protein